MMVQCLLAGFDTRRESYRALLESGRVSEKQRVVFEFLRTMPERGYTFQEICKGLGWKINEVTPRVNELCYDLGVVESVGVVKNLQTGRGNKLWRIRK